MGYIWTVITLLGLTIFTSDCFSGSPENLNVKCSYQLVRVRDLTKEHAHRLVVIHLIEYNHQRSYNVYTIGLQSQRSH